MAFSLFRQGLRRSAPMSRMFRVPQQYVGGRASFSTLVKAGCQVVCHMRIKDPQTGKVIVDTTSTDPNAQPDSTNPHTQPPVSFVVGKNNVLPGIDRKIQGLAVGEHFEEVFGPEDAFGIRDLKKIIEIPLRKNPKTGQLAESRPQVGYTVHLSDGTLGKVVRVGEDTVTVDTNHEFAGKPMEILIKVLEIDEEPRPLFEGIKMQINSPGDGKTFPQTGDDIKVHYVGYLEDGTCFDQSSREKPLAFKIGVGRVIRGWDEGLKKVSLGEQARLLIAADHAYGEKGAPPTIPPNSNLVFDVELVEINGKRLGD